MKSKTDDPRRWLQFDPPNGTDERSWTAAEAQCFKFPERYVQKCREANERQQELIQLDQDRRQQMAFVVRNLLDIVDTCESALEQVTDETPTTEPATEPIAAAVEEAVTETTADTQEANAAETREAQPAPAEPENVETAGLSSVHRLLLYMLEELGVRRIDLIGQTYGSVVVDGRTIEDPFEVVESAGGGKASERPVQQVLGDLWVDREGRVIRRGKVIC